MVKLAQLAPEQAQLGRWGRLARLALKAQLGLVVVLLVQREQLALLVAQQEQEETLSFGKTTKMSPLTIQFPQTKTQ
jgi:hypothetical protein